MQATGRSVLPDVPGEGLEDARKRLDLLPRIGENRIELGELARDRDVKDAFGPGAQRRLLRLGNRYDLADFRIVDERWPATKLESPHGRARDPVVDVVKERDDEVRFEKIVLELS
jgi:hypothetical protein